MLVYKKIGASLAIFTKGVIYLQLLLICVESDKIPLLCKLKQLYKHLPVGFLIAITYTAKWHTVQVVTKMASSFLYSIRIVIT